MLSKSETSDLLDRISAAWPQHAAPKVKSIKVYEIEDGSRLLVADDAVVALQIADRIVPFIGGNSELLDRFPSVTVDMGAVRFVCNGAKVMRPGITNIGSFRKGDIVTVRDQQHGKYLAVGIALDDSESAQTMTKGYVIDNIHYISDKAWEASKQI
ncbi:MAG: PUA domain-containing protein [Nitrososphaera sp.]